MNRSEQLGELAAALAQAQGVMLGAKKDSDNPYFKSKYADLASVVEAIRGPLSAHGLSYVQIPIPTEGDWVRVETVLLHASGQWISGTVEVPVSKADAHGYGGALTYARRYGLSSIVGVAQEDDDGNAATQAKPRPTEAEMMPTAKGRRTMPEAPPNIPEAEPRPRPTRFTIAKAEYHTAGMTEQQMRQSFDLVPAVDRKLGKDYCRGLLKDEFGVVSRSDLTEETAERFLVRLQEIASG
jgi:hypothetical protein